MYKFDYSLRCRQVKLMAVGLLDYFWTHDLLRYAFGV